MKPSEYGKEKGNRILIYGEPKSGKTEAVAWLSKYFKLIWLDLESGATTIVTRIPPKYHENIEIVSIPDTRENPVAIKYVTSILKGEKVLICDKHGVHNCVKCKMAQRPSVLVDVNALDNKTFLVIDSGTQLSESAICKATRDLDNEDKIEFKHWAQQGFHLADVLSLIQNASFNVAFIAHEMESEGADKEKAIRPMCGTRNFSKQFARYFDHVVYCEKNGSMQHVLATGSDYQPRLITGSRSDLAIEKMKKVLPEDRLAMLVFASKPDLDRPPEIAEYFAQIAKDAEAKAAAANAKPVVKPSSLIKR